MPGALSAHAAPSGHAASAVSAAKKTTGSLPVSGSIQNGPAFTGQLSNLRTKVEHGTLMLTGTITGTNLPAGGTKFKTPIQPTTASAGTAAGASTLAAPVQSAVAAASCPILNLNLGPLHLNLLGLVVDLAPVILNITAVPGAGNLLGNLLCAVAGLLDGTGNLAIISQLLNQLLAGLGL